MKNQPHPLRWRGRVVLTLIFLCSLSIVSRLFFLQVISADELTNRAEKQYQQKITSTGSRGNLYFADGSLLVGNQTVYRIFAEPALFDTTPEEIAEQLAEILVTDSELFETASSGARLDQSEQLITELTEKLRADNRTWIGLKEKISETTKQEIERKKISGIGFDQYEVRYYPEASMAAQLTGFIGKTEDGEDIGYFGLEGALEKELQPQNSQRQVIRDALGGKLFSGKEEFVSLNGRDITTTIDRDIQKILERELLTGILKYEARGGEAIAYEPKTGKIIGLAAAPTFDQARFYQFEPEVYKNPALTEQYEPGSTFKILTVAAGLDTNAIKPDTKCDTCEGPRQFGTFTIRTWNDTYYPDTTMSEALAHSDNTAMIFIAEKLGHETFREYLQKFGIGRELGIDLQGDRNTPFPDSWRPVETATRSFGQGITVSSLQLIRAVGAVANDGVLLQPQIISSVFDPVTTQTHEVESLAKERVLQEETAVTLQEMLTYAAERGEAQWTYSQKIPVAGKTGTSQVAEEGGYKEEATITSFIGFSPPHNPDFLLFVKLQEPQSSPWAAETAAPLWFRIAEQISLSLRQ
ncbi:MAG: penicillin-binding protein 2 [bacterium]|nr:penicillin-binding protein 2 [bacterium]